mgnify:FL=1
MGESLAERLASLVSPGPNGSDIKQLNTPEAWRPRMEVGPEGGFIVATARPTAEMPDAITILEEFKLDPEHWTVTSLRRGQWQKFDGEWLESVRINVVPSSTIKENDLDLEKLISEISKWRPSTKEKRISGELAYVFAPSDQQVGKKGSGGGTIDFVARILETTEGGVHRLKELRKIGRPIGTVAIALLGDHVEGNVSQAGRLQGQAASDLGLTEQTRVARRLLMSQIKAFAPLAEKIIVPVVNGNHDEVTRQISADPADGWNVEIASAVQDACAENPELQHIEFRFPESDHQTLAVNINGTMLGLFHGHQSGKDVTKYLSGQAAGQTALGNCDVWLSGHYHHFKSMDIGPRFWAQCPTLDPGSAWFRDRTGLESPAGILSMVIGAGYDPRKDLSIISASRN